jgi:UDPglucose 6-dehydrogenase
VGLVVGACLGETGNDVTCADVDVAKIEGLKQNVMPIYEPGLDALVERNQRQGRLTFTTDLAAAMARADVIFIAVGTPPDEDGSADLRHVLDVAEQIGKHVTREVVIVTKSTVPVGTADKVSKAVAKNARFPFHMCSNPEFLKEGAALDDFMKPDRVVLGVESDHARSVMAELYAPFVRTGKPIIFMDIPSAEMTKYAANAMLATRISFMNELANLADQVGADIEAVRHGIGSDPRIGHSFLYAGAGYGGSCFPKDVQALERTARQYDQELLILRAVEAVNDRQKQVLGRKVVQRFGADLTGMKFAVWGLAFKPNTDDMREAPSRVLLKELIERGAKVAVHDPVAMEEAQRVLALDLSADQLARIAFTATPMEALDGAEALVIVTEWKAFRSPDFEQIKARLKHPVIIDGRNLFEPPLMTGLGIEYHGIGRSVLTGK